MQYYRLYVLLLYLGTDIEFMDRFYQMIFGFIFWQYRG